MKRKRVQWVIQIIAAFLGATLTANAIELDPQEAFKTLGWAGVFLSLYLLQFYDHRKQRDAWEKYQQEHIEKLLKVLTDNSDAMTALTNAIDKRSV